MKKDIIFGFEDVTNEPKRNMDVFSFFGEVGVFRKKDGAVLAMIDFTVYKKNKEMSEMRIDQFEVVTEETGKGYGKACIEILKDLYPNVRKIEGIAYDGSESFWFGLGADFCNSCENCSIAGTEDCPLQSYGEVCDEYSENEFSITY